MLLIKQHPFKLSNAILPTLSKIFNQRKTTINEAKQLKQLTVQKKHAYSRIKQKPKITNFGTDCRLQKKINVKQRDTRGEKSHKPQNIT